VTLKPADLIDQKAAREVYLEEQWRLPATPDRGADRRSQARARQHLADTFLPPDPPDMSPDELYAASLLAVATHAGLSPLEAAVMAYEMDDLTQAETAAALGRPLGTVKSASRRVKRKLRPLAGEVARKPLAGSLIGNK